GEEHPGSRAVSGGQLRLRERREDTRLVPQGGSPGASEREDPFEGTRGGGEIAARELRGAEERARLHLSEEASALVRQRDGTAAVVESAGEIPPQAQHLAQERVGSVEGLQCLIAILGQECLESGLGLDGVPQVCARQ